MPTIRMYPNDVLRLTVKNEQSDGTFIPSATPPTWALDDHTLAEFRNMAPDGHSIDVLAIDVGTVGVTASLDTGDVIFTLGIVVAPTPTSTPVGNYERNPPIEPGTPTPPAPPS